MVAKTVILCVIVCCIVRFSDGLECLEGTSRSQAPCTGRGGVCVYADRCKAKLIGTSQEQSTLCPSDGNGLPGGVCCPKDDPANGACNEGPSAGSVCMAWCGISVRWPGNGCSGSCPMCCTLVG